WLHKHKLPARPPAGKSDNARMGSGHLRALAKAVGRGGFVPPAMAMTTSKGRGN
ncbi:hypothetical protein BHM03_00061214, partial [Ensete ventricosum]